MIAYQNGDFEAFSELYRRYAPKLNGYALKKLGERQVASDVVQTVFLKLHRTRESFEPGHDFAPWLFTIAYRAIVDALRERSLARARGHQGDPEEIIGKTADPRTSLESAASIQDPQAHLGSLPTAQREAVLLRYGEELDFEAIADRLKTSPANARQLVSRGLRALREKLGKGGASS